MKNNLTSLIIAGTMFVSCSTQRRLTYEFPAEMAPHVKAQYVQQWEKGKVLYEITCAKCHNYTVRGKEVIPDFSQEKLKGYEMRVANGEHERSMPDEKVTAEELVLISTFLLYKKKS